MLRFPYTRVNLRRPAPSLSGAVIRYLPFLEVGVEGPSGTIVRRMRLDSGADDTILPVLVASQLGIDLNGAPLGQAEAAGGAIITYPCARVTLRISDGVESCVWDATVGFLSVSRQTGLAGLAGFLDFFDATLHGQGREFTLQPNASFSGQHAAH